MTSIRRALLVRLLLGLVAVAALATLATYVETRREIGELFDLQLKQLAYSTRIDDLLRGRPPQSSPREGRRVEGVSEIVTQIWDRDGVLVYWSQPGAGLPVSVTEGYSDVVHDGRIWRVYTHVTGDHALQIAHALDERREIAAQAALRTLLPMALLIPFLGILIWYAVGRGLRSARNDVARGRQRAGPTLMAPHRRRRPAARAQAARGEPQRVARTGSTRRLPRSGDSPPTPRTNCEPRSRRSRCRSGKPSARATRRRARRPSMISKLGVARTSRLVEQLLTMARLEPEGLSRNLSRVDLGALANDAIVARAPLAEARGIDLGRTGAADVPVQGDAANLATLLANLLDNALRYTPSGGRIDVAIDREAGQAVLSVTDTGPGIPAAARERVFERFHREPNPDDATFGMGSGLGLSIVRRIADAHGATVTLDAGADGKGLVVRVRFPRPSILKVPLSGDPYIASCRPGRWAYSLIGEHDATHKSNLRPDRCRHRRRLGDGLYALRYVGGRSGAGGDPARRSGGGNAEHGCGRESSRLHGAGRPRRRIRRQHQRRPLQGQGPDRPRRHRRGQPVLRILQALRRRAERHRACARNSPSPRVASARASS